MAQLPLAFRSEAHKERSTDGEIKLFTITHASLGTPIYIANRWTQLLSTEPLKYGVISSGVTYEYMALSDEWPDDIKGAPARATITVDNVASGMVAIARAITGSAADVAIKIVMESEPDVAVANWTGLKIRNARFDENSVTFTLSSDAEWHEPMGRLMTKDQFPGLHGIRSA